ncbi:unnamed protein product, partial [Prorocentrum cordatum]
MAGAPGFLLPSGKADRLQKELEEAQQSRNCLPSAASSDDGDLRRDVAAGVRAAASSCPAARAPASCPAARAAASGKEVRAGGTPATIKHLDCAVNGAAPRVRWCSEQLSRCNEPQGLTVRRAPSEGACRFAVNATAGTATSWEAVVTDPPPGPAQWNLMRRLVFMAQSSGAHVTGPASEELLRGGPMSTGQVSEVLQPPLSFPVALGGTSTGKLDSVILRIPAEWRGDLQSPNTTAPCIAIVERAEDCGPCAFPQRLCSSQALWPVPPGPEAPAEGQATPGALAVELQRPAFLPRSWEELQRAEPAHSVCLRGGARGEDEGPIVLGKLQYYALPRVTFVPAIARVGIRTFLNPGWLRHLQLQCENCSQLSRVAIRPLTLDPSCRGLEKESLATATAAAWHGEMPAPGPGGVDMASSGSKIAEVVRQQREGKRESRAPPCKIPEQGPCYGFAEASLALGLPTGDLGAGADGNGIVYKLESSRRLSSSERQVFFHHRSALCFYPDGSTNNGWLIGFTAVHMDSFDMQAFIGFVCFFGVALPLVCLATALLHHNKYELCKQHLHRMRLDYQRAQLDRELAALGAGGGPRRPQPAGAAG